jgi:hypothetical protein
MLGGGLERLAKARFISQCTAWVDTNVRMKVGLSMAVVVELDGP